MMFKSVDSSPHGRPTAPPRPGRLRGGLRQGAALRGGSAAEDRRPRRLGRCRGGNGAAPVEGRGDDELVMCELLVEMRAKWWRQMVSLMAK